VNDLGDNLASPITTRRAGKQSTSTFGFPGISR
jgi:hypothetical protein